MKKKGRIFWLLTNLIFSACLASPLQEEEALRHIYAYLFIHDPFSAAKEAEKNLKLYPQSEQLQFAYIQSLTEKGDEMEAFQQWVEAAEGLQKNRHALETLAWGVLKKGNLSPQLNIHLNAVIGAALTRDVRAVPILVNGMRDTNALLRLISVKFAALYGDGPLQEELIRMLSEEKVWFVRLEVIRSIGTLHMSSLRSDLKAIMASNRTLAEEKGEAIIALVQMYDGISQNDLKILLTSNRAGLRQLGCQLVSHFDLREQAHQLIPLLNDTSPDVRSEAIYALGLLKIPLKKSMMEEVMNDTSPEVAMTACWAAALQSLDEGILGLLKWVHDGRGHDQSQLLAAAALSSCGAEAAPFIFEAMKSHKNPLVKLNLALGLIGQRKWVEEACDTIYQILQDDQETLLMWDDHSHFKVLSPSRLFHINHIPNYPNIVDQKTRLDFLNILCMMHHPKSQDAVKKYIKHRPWGITGAAAVILLEEGDQEAMDVVRALLKDTEPEVRVQAAFILAMIGNDPEAVQVLQEAYPLMSRDLKIHILEAIGHVGDLESIPFLMNIFNEPFQLTRVVAASAVIQCLYH